jgi:6-phosphogluconate dehydrogenase
MVHSGTKYGLMAVYVERLTISRPVNAGLRQRAMAAETTPLRHPERYHCKGPDLADFHRHVSDSGEGRWTLQAAIDEDALTPAISAAPYARFSACGQAEYADKPLSVRRFEFANPIEKPTGSVR